MLNKIGNIYNSLIFRLTFSVGLVLLVTIFTWASFTIKYQEKNSFDKVVSEVDRLANTIKLGTHYAMMLNSRDDINEIVKNIGRHKEIENIRVFNKKGRIEFSNVTKEIGQVTNIKNDACFICHGTEPPLETVGIEQRTRIFDSAGGYRLLGIISPIYNEPGCSSDGCHYHPEDKTILGALDVVVSLDKTDKDILSYQRRLVVLFVFSFLAASTIAGVFLLIFVNRPIKKLIRWTRLIGKGEYDIQKDSYDDMDLGWSNELDHLSAAINQMGQRIREKQEKLNQQKDEYQQLFEQVPCYITVHDKNLKLLRYNQEFIKHFDPSPGDYCYKVYKGRTERCETCPVMETFADGKTHYSEETGINKDGSTSHWLVQTAPIEDAGGEITAVMEMNIDITIRKRLEEGIRQSEAKYRDIFNNIPYPVFVLDKTSLEILDCNDRVTDVYGFDKQDIVQTSFLRFFDENEQGYYSSNIKKSDILDIVRHTTKDRRTIFVNIRISPSEDQGREALLVTTINITEKLMTEQHLIQAGKMATLGEMATGIAHELNQPLTVIKTASSFFVKKINKSEKIDDHILKTMSKEIEDHVDRASKIIRHLRAFGRKSEVSKTKVDVNEPLKKALDMFSQQLKLEKILVVEDFAQNLPPIMADSNRLEQIFINLLLNARDAIQERWEQSDHIDEIKTINLKTDLTDKMVTIKIKDNGSGIPDHVRHRIFEPFFTTKQISKGTGLGLSISYGIVQDYDGTIMVESRKDEGAEFIIQFPPSSTTK